MWWLVSPGPGQSVAFRCPECRTRRKDPALFTKHLQDTGHRLCICGGYHYAHRPGSPYCVKNPTSALHEASRHGADDADLVRAARYTIEITPSAEAKIRELMKTWNLNDFV